ncbi:hypothetical protein [Anaerotignum sp.]|uniref:hypothetical protein n=1 Tax=Anaerotignum sp. TaxID=2039241 RepID=UPI002714BE55|nr:hypothetical protein [Anaerotignum sp.]
MKKYIVYLISALLLLGTAGCSGKEKDAEPQQAQMEGGQLQDMATMKEPIDSLVRCMLENDKTYDPTNPEFFWSALYYFLGNYGTQNPLVTTTEEGQIKVPKKVVQEYAIALFANYDDLLPLPGDVSNSISYDEDLDAYLLSPGDAGLSDTVLSDYKAGEDSYTVTAKLLNDVGEKETLGEWTVTMQKNVFADGIEDPRYFYSVSSVTPVEGLTTPLKNASAFYNGLSDNHTVEVTLEDGTIEAFQFYDAAVSEKLHSLKEGDAFSFVYTCDDETGAMTIQEIN